VCTIRRVGLCSTAVEWRSGVLCVAGFPEEVSILRGVVGKFAFYSIVYSVVV
jgi:hypothetical protein